MRLKALVCAVLPLVALTGCIDSLMHDDLSDCPPSEAMQACYIQLSVRMAEESQTRADDPTGGEKGDGYENAQDYEDAVSSVAVFLYQGYLSGDNRDAKVSFALFSADDEELTSGTSPSSNKYGARYTSIVKKVWIYEGGMHHVLVAANPSEDLISWAQGKFNSNTLTLGDVLDRIETKAWEEEDGSYSSFLMSSHDDVEVELSGRSEDDPAKVKVDVQRMAARVDYTMGDAARGTTFTISDDQDLGDPNYKGSTVEITGAMLVNNLSSGSYLFKRVSDGVGSDVEYLGLETSDANDVSTNYVIDPWTDSKDGTDVASISGLGYGVYYPGYAQNPDPNGDNQQNPSYWSDLITPWGDATSMGDDWKRMGYTMENTTYSQYTSKKYCTGAVFEATFTPADDLVISEFYDDYDYKTDGGGTFFRWNDKLYATVEDVMMAAYPEGSIELYGDNITGFEPEESKYYSNSFDHHIVSSCSRWGAIRQFAESLRDDDPTGYKHFLLAEYVNGNHTDDQYVNARTGPTQDKLYWSYYMKTVCGYTLSCDDEGNYTMTLDQSFVDPNYTTTRAALYAESNGATRTYEDGKCFYSWWIRHSNDENDETNGTMEFSIVRNNAYKLTLDSVYSLGGDVPEEGIVIHAGVNDWGILDEEDVELVKQPSWQ
ncbi:MAG: Mfa1 family fimbria major subunit [Prevotellaceae bacterium]|nr:Mfa1 family fimbria major subunit [Prevotellaceae bacterium]